MLRLDPIARGRGGGIEQTHAPGQVGDHLGEWDDGGQGDRGPRTPGDHGQPHQAAHPPKARAPRVSAAR